MQTVADLRAQARLHAIPRLKRCLERRKTKTKIRSRQRRKNCVKNRSKLIIRLLRKHGLNGQQCSKILNVAQTDHSTHLIQNFFQRSL